MVNDGSTDETATIAEKEGALVISHLKNKGVGAAFHSAIKTCLQYHVDIMVSIDADGQFNGQDIPRLIRPILENKADFVTANRFASKKRPKNMSAIKFWGNHQMSRLISMVVGQKIEDVACGFRAYSKEALLNLNLIGQFTYTQETILDLCHKGFQLIEVPTEVKYFPERKSRVAGSIINYTYRSLLIILRSFRDYRPLRFFGGMGLIIFGIGGGLDIWLLIHFFRYGTFSPYKSIGFLGGLLNILGILTIIMALLADMLDRIRLNQEKILYFEKKRQYHEQN